MACSFHVEHMAEAFEERIWSHYRVQEDQLLEKNSKYEGIASARFSEMEILFVFCFCFSKIHVRFYLTDIQYLAICQMLMKNCSRVCSSEILFKFVALVVLHHFISLFFFLSTIFFSSVFFSILLFYITPIEFIPETTSRNDARPVFISLIIGIPEYQSVLFASPRGIFISSSFNSGVWHFTDCVPATMAAVRGAARTPRV